MSRGSKRSGWRRPDRCSPTRIGCFPSKLLNVCGGRCHCGKDAARHSSALRKLARHPSFARTRCAFPSARSCSHYRTQPPSSIASSPTATSSPSFVAPRTRRPFSWVWAALSSEPGAPKLSDCLVAPTDVNIAVRSLDSGVRRTHPLLEPALAEADRHTINPAWGADDTPAWQGHGTRMAGVTLYGDLFPVLAGGELISPSYRLESVRILPPASGPANDPELYGAITGEAIARSESQAPQRRRVIAMAVTSANPTRGRPSSWSAAVDQLCFEEENRRLIILSAGNIAQDLIPDDHLVRNDLEPVDDPAHAWNALTVGAFTDKVDIIDPAFAGYAPIAPAGELSPRSRTSVTWDRQWPVKPDVVFEGGNLAHDGTLPGEAIDDLQMILTHSRLENRHFTAIGDTSAATAHAAGMAGGIIAALSRHLARNSPRADRSLRRMDAGDESAHR